MVEVGELRFVVHIREVLGSSPCSPIVQSARIAHRTGSRNDYPCGLCSRVLVPPATTRADANASRAVCTLHRIIGDADLADQPGGSCEAAEARTVHAHDLTSPYSLPIRTKPGSYDGLGHPVRALSGSLRRASSGYRHSHFNSRVIQQPVSVMPTGARYKSRQVRKSCSWLISAF